MQPTQSPPHCFIQLICDDYNLDGMLSEAIKMATNAQALIDEITSARVFTGIFKDSRMADNARNLFNIPVSAKAIDASAKGTMAILRKEDKEQQGIRPGSHCKKDLAELARSSRYTKR